MYSFRGDAHKFFLKLKNTVNTGQSVSRLDELEEVKKIKSLYEEIDRTDLKFIYYRMLKENNGSGIIPIFVTAVPWFLFLFSKQLQHFLFKHGSYLWLIFSITYVTILTVSVILHFREKAWAAIHIEILKDILKEKDGTNS